MDEKHDREAEVEATGAGHGNPDEDAVFKVYLHAPFDKPGEGKADGIQEDVGHNQERLDVFQSLEIAVDQQKAVEDNQNGPTDEKTGCNTINSAVCAHASFLYHPESAVENLRMAESYDLV